LQIGLGFTPSQAGVMLLTVGISGIIGKYFVNGLVERFGYRTFLSKNTILLGTFMACGFFISASTPYWVIVAILFAFGFANSMQFTAMTTLALVDLPKDYTSEGNMMLSVIMQVSMSLGVSIGAAMLGFFNHDPDLYSNPSVMKAFNLTYLSMGLFTMLTSLTFLFTPKNAGK
jgi:predicted MFS family arabinose efflux permease